MSNTTDSYEQLLAIIRGSKSFQDLMTNPNVSLNVTITNTNPGIGENFRQTTVFGGMRNYIKSTENKDESSDPVKDWEQCLFFGRPSLILRGRKITKEERKWVTDNHFFIYDIREECGKPLSVEKPGIFVDKYGTLVTWVNVIDLNIGLIDFLPFNSNFNDFVVDEEPELYYQISDIKAFKTAFNEQEMLAKAKTRYIYPCTECNRCLSCVKADEFKKAYEGMLQYAKDHPEFMSQTPENVAKRDIICEGRLLGYLR